MGLSAMTLLFIIVLEALFREIKSGCSDELLSAGDLELLTGLLKGLKRRLNARKELMLRR